VAKLVLDGWKSRTDGAGVLRVVVLRVDLRLKVGQLKAGVRGSKRSGDTD